MGPDNVAGLQKTQAGVAYKITPATLNLPKSRRPTVVILPGDGQGAESFDLIAAQLASLGIRSVSLSYHGQAGSDPLTGSASLEGYGDDVRDVLVELKPSLESGVAFLTCSRGAAVACEYAKKHGVADPEVGGMVFVGYPTLAGISEPVIGPKVLWKLLAAFVRNGFKGASFSPAYVAERFFGNQLSPQEVSERVLPHRSPIPWSIVLAKPPLVDLNRVGVRCLAIFGAADSTLKVTPHSGSNVCRVSGAPHFLLETEQHVPLAADMIDAWL